jgi:hypothetical protein
MSKELAQKIAEMMSVNKEREKSKLLEQYRKTVTDEYIKQTPTAALELLELHPDWVQTNTEIYFSGHGFGSYERVSAIGAVIRNSSPYAKLKLTPEIAAKISTAKNKYEKAEKEWVGLKQEIETALLALKTFNQIQKNLPEAVPFLPKENQSIMLNFDDLRNKLK